MSVSILSRTNENIYLKLAVNFCQDFGTWSSGNYEMVASMAIRRSGFIILCVVIVFLISEAVLVNVTLPLHCTFYHLQLLSVLHSTLLPMESSPTLLTPYLTMIWALWLLITVTLGFFWTSP